MRQHRLLLLVTLAGFGLRMLMLDRFPFREDEAIYSYWALHGWHEDPLFLTVWPDKPPIFIWLLGIAYRLFGVEAASARMVNVAASTLTIPVVAVTARRLWGERAALVAALVLALSPFAISFAPTAFVDPVLVLFGSLALYAAVAGHPLAAGLFLGAAIMTKQQGVLYAPLVILLLLGVPHPRGANRSQAWPWRRVDLRPSVAFLFGVAGIVLPIMFWDSRRWAVAPSPWDLSVRNYATLSWLPPGLWLNRLRDWQDLIWHLTASNLVWLILLFVFLFSVVLTVIVGFRRQRNQRNSSANQHCAANGQTYIAALLALWSMGFILFHVMTSVQIWDRYLLPLAPMLALLAGWVAACLLPKTWPGRVDSPPVLVYRIALIAFALLLAMPAWQAANGKLAIGGDHGAYAGLDEAVSWIEAQNENAALYHDTLGWHFRFYLYTRLQTDRLELRWFPSSTYLVDNVEKTPHLRKFYVAPDWADRADLVQRMKMRGLTLTSQETFAHFTIYEMGAPRAASCDWCLCRDETPRVGWQQALPTGPMTYAGLAVQ